MISVLNQHKKIQYAGSIIEFYHDFMLLNAALWIALMKYASTDKKNRIMRQYKYRMDYQHYKVQVLPLAINMESPFKKKVIII